MPFSLGDSLDAGRASWLFAYNGPANIGLVSELEAARKSLLD
jgi:hypothetical protein